MTGAQEEQEPVGCRGAIFRALPGWRKRSEATQCGRDVSRPYRR